MALSAADERDRAWAPDREQEIEEAFESESAPASFALTSVVCGSRVCKVTLEYREDSRSPDTLQELRDLLSTAPFMGATTYLAATDDWALLITSRPGLGLPNPDEL